MPVINIGKNKAIFASEGDFIIKRLNCKTKILRYKGHVAAETFMPADAFNTVAQGTFVCLQTGLQEDVSTSAAPPVPMSQMAHIGCLVEIIALEDTDWECACQSLKLSGEKAPYSATLSCIIWCTRPKCPA